MTSAQRYNARMDKIFEEAKKNKDRHVPLHIFTMLERLTEKVERANAIQHSGGPIEAEDWSELFMLTNEAKAILHTARNAEGPIKDLLNSHI